MGVWIKNHYKVTGVFVLAFFIPFFIMALVFWGMEIAPFGERSILIMDMSEQYVSFIAELRNIITGNSSVFFSWSKSYGCNFVGVFAYYIASPLSFFALLFSDENLPVAIMWLTCLKIGLSGLALSVFFKYAFQKCGVMTVLLSVCYALMSYTSVYTISIMWLDALIWLPLILLGIEKLLKGKLPWLLTMSVTFMFISQYYISYMVGIFSVLYFLLRYFGEKRDYLKELKAFLYFLVSVLLSAGLSAWLLLPAGMDLFAGKLANSAVTADTGWYFSPMELLHKLLPGQYDGITYISNGSLPSVFCGMTVLVFSAVYFFIPWIKIRERVISLALLIFFAVSFCSKQLDFIWHVFQYPNWFPYRYAFLFSFFLVFLAFRAMYAVPFRRILKERIKNVRILKWVNRAAIPVLAVLLCYQTYEMFGNSKTMIEGLDKDFKYETLEAYQGFYSEIEPLIKPLKNSDEFFRMEKTFERKKNDTMTFGYKGVMHYSSTYNDRINRFTKQLGFAQAWFWSSYFGNTMLTDMLFNMKYMLSRNELSSYYERIGESGSTVLYENPYTLPVGYFAKDISPVAGRTFQAQNQMLNQISGTETDYFEACEAVNPERNQYTFTASKTAPYYLYIPMEDRGWGTINVNNQFRGNYFSDETRCIVYIGDYTAGESVAVEIDSDITVSSIEICSLDMEKLEETYHKLKTGGLIIENYDKNSISGTINAPEGGMMMTSIPFDEGWHVTADGKSRAAQKAFDTFLCFDVPAGTKKIELHYTAPGQTAGLIISVISVLAVLMVLGLYYLRYRKHKDYPASA